jgi:hypothetical protein
MSDLYAEKPKPRPEDADYGYALIIFKALSDNYKVYNRVAHPLGNEMVAYQFVGKDPRRQLPEIVVTITGSITDPDAILVKGDYLRALGTIQLSGYVAIV